MTKYHDPSSCNNCGEENVITATDHVDLNMCECRAKCKVCCFEDYWAHGFYESSESMLSKCKTYQFELDDKEA